VQAITATLSRWQAGKHGDRYGHARLLIPALAVTALGMAEMMVLGSPVLIFAGMVLFGAGFGVIENATFALLIERLPEAKASALWNFAYDAGYGAGPAVFGLICVRTGYPAAFALAGALVLAVVPIALRERKGVAAVLPWMRDRMGQPAARTAAARHGAGLGARLPVRRVRTRVPAFRVRARLARAAKASRSAGAPQAGCRHPRPAGTGGEPVRVPGVRRPAPSTVPQPGVPPAFRADSS